MAWQNRELLCVHWRVRKASLDGKLVLHRFKLSRIKTFQFQFQLNAAKLWHRTLEKSGKTPVYVKIMRNMWNYNGIKGNSISLSGISMGK